MTSPEKVYFYLLLLCISCIIQGFRVPDPDDDYQVKEYGKRHEKGDSSEYRKWEDTSDESNDFVVVTPSQPDPINPEEANNSSGSDAITVKPDAGSKGIEFSNADVSKVPFPSVGKMQDMSIQYDLKPGFAKKKFIEKPRQVPKLPYESWVKSGISFASPRFRAKVVF